MTIEEAESLAEHVAGELRSQDAVKVYQLGNHEWVCIVLRFFFLWSPADWTKFQLKANGERVKRSVGRPKRAILVETATH